MSCLNRATERFFLNVNHIMSLFSLKHSNPAPVSYLKVSTRTSRLYNLIPLISLTLSSTARLLTHFVQAALASLLFFKESVLTTVSRPLHFLFLSFGPFGAVWRMDCGRVRPRQRKTTWEASNEGGKKQLNLNIYVT